MSPRFLLLIPFCILLGACSTTGPQGANIYRTVKSEEGVASWYGGPDIGGLTATGEHYHMYDMTAAHKTLPFNTMVRVTNLVNNKSVIVRINDRGPYVRGRMIDLTVNPANQIGLIHQGLTRVKMDVLVPIPVMMKPNLKLPPEPPSPPLPAEAFTEPGARRHHHTTAVHHSHHSSSSGGSTSSGSSSHTSHKKHHTHHKTNE